MAGVCEPVIDPDDPRAPVRGCCLGVALGVGLWAVVVLGLWLWLQTG